MYRAQTFLILAAATAWGSDFSGASAFKFTEQAVNLGPRPSGSEASRKLQEFILTQLKTHQCEVTVDLFPVPGPYGTVEMKNIVARFKGTSGRSIAITGHYDTKLFPGRKFVGANDGGSSTGLLLEMARALDGEKRTDDVILVFFDGEEAFDKWSISDKLYGSRHTVERWKADGTLGRLKAFINVDMIGDKDLRIKKEVSSNKRVVSLVWKAAADLGYKKHFVDETLEIDDDHMPFVDAGAPAIDLIDFEYDPWHEDSDTLDKLSAKSLDVVGKVVKESIRRIEAQK
jgi:glutaminyl-peptide cyclotransferase